MGSWYDVVSFLAARTIGALPAKDLVGIWIDPVWIAHGDSLPAPAQAVLAAFDAASRRDAMQLRPRAIAALEQLRLEPRAPDALREQMLVLAMLGAIAEGRPDQVAAFERSWGEHIPSSDTYGPIRIYLQAWADLPGEPTP
jgi:spermidine synthase